jgi:esterase/lipase
MPPGPFALAGLSLGGMISSEIMQICPERVTRLAMLDTGARGRSEAEQAVRRSRIRLAEEGHFELVLGLQLSRFIPAYRLPDKKLVDEILAMCTEIGVEIYKRQETMAVNRIDRRADLAKVKCPTIVVCGRDDAATPLVLSEEIAASIKGSELIVVENCGHLVTMEKPEETNAILRKWLTAPSPRAWPRGLLSTISRKSWKEGLSTPRRFGRDDGYLTTFFSRSAFTSASLMPAISRSTVSVCSPSEGGGRVSSTGVSEKR